MGDPVATEVSKGASTRPKVIALASGGGHWVQLLRLRPAFDGCDVLFASVWGGYQTDVPGFRFAVIPKADRWSKASVIRSFFAIFRLLLRERPDVIITTGAAPGYLAIRVGKWLRIRTLWIDSVANHGELSMSGRKVGRYADGWLTQWPHLASPAGPDFQGSVL